MEHILQSKLRAYRFAYWSVALTETACLGALLISLFNPSVAPLALLWLAWKFVRRPGNLQIVSAVEAKHPQLGKQLSAAVELADSTDPPAVKGSPELLENVFADADRAAAPIEFHRLIALKPVAALIIATIVVNLALSHRREQAGSQLGGRGSSRATPDVGSPGGSPSRPTISITSLATALKSQPDRVLRELSPHARSLDSVVESASQAAAAQAAGNIADAQALQQTVAETLSEFARLARQIPELGTLANDADRLAQHLAAAASVTPVATAGRSPTTDAEIPAAALALLHGDAPTLPAAPAGTPWTAPVEKVSGFPENYPPQYEQLISDYFERLATASR